jgi:hypothetical protein
MPTRDVKENVRKMTDKKKTEKENKIPQKRPQCTALPSS